MIALALALGLCLFLPQGAGSEPPVRVFGPTPAVVTLGASCMVELRYEGSETAGQPEVATIAGARTRVLPLSEESSMQWLNGRMTSSRQLRWRIQITPEHVGTVTIPPIGITIGGKTYHIKELTFEVIKEATGQQRAFLDITPSATRVYVNEPLRFDVDYGIDARLNPAQVQRGIFDVRIQAAWLSDLDGAVSMPSEDEDANVQLVLNDQVQRVAWTENYLREGKRYHRFQFTKAFLPSRVGKIELPAPVLRYTVITREGVGTFFGPAGQETQTLHAYGEPLTIDVLPLPEEGRPSPYYGAVGRFKVRVELDKTRVKVGNSVKLTFTIEGLGNTEFLHVPDLAELAGFHLLGQKIERKPEQVVVTYDLTPLTAEVKDVPAIAWNYFDTAPDAERYVDVTTSPLPLSVVPLAEGETLAPLPGEEPKAVTPGVDDIFDMKALAEGEPAPPPSPPSSAVTWAAALGPWLAGAVLAAALARRARRSADVLGQRARGAGRTFQRAIAAGDAPADALAGYVADRLGVATAAVIGPDLAQRLIDAGFAAELAADVAAAIELGVAARYGGGGGLDADPARALVARLEREPSAPASAAARAGSVATWLLAGLLTGLFAGRAATQSAAAEGERAYRAGDYATAAAAFARAAAEPDADRRTCYDLGNALYRQGKLGQALVAYERARLALPRDAELAANRRLVRQRLALGSGAGEPFLDAVAALRASFTPRELLLACAACHTLAAAGLLLLRRRVLGRWIGALALVPAVLLTLELAWFAPSRPPKGIVVAAQASVVAEPRDGLEPVLTLREGVEVEVLGAGPKWTRVRVQDRAGYVPADAVAVVE